MSGQLQALFGKPTTGSAGPIAPVANFTGTPTTGTVPYTVTFTDTSTNAPTSWLWTFGDGTTSTLQNPTHSYAYSGTFTVSLKATNAAGNNTFTRTNYIVANNSPYTQSLNYYTLPIGGNWSGAYGNGNFVLVGNAVGYGVLTSTDGYNWTQRTRSISGTFWRTAYGNGKFVSLTNVSGAGSMYSTDNGATWTAGGTLPTGSPPYCITYGAGRFVAGYTNSSICAYSNDGINWNTMNMPYSTNWLSIAYGNGKFVAVSSRSTGAYFATSTDGINWSGYSSSTYTLGYYVSFDDKNGVFMIRPSSSAGATAISTDGVNWTTKASIQNGTWSTGLGGNGGFVMSSNAVILTTADNGGSFTQYTASGGAAYTCTVYGNGKFILTNNSLTSYIVMT